MKLCDYIYCFFGSCKCVESPKIGVIEFHNWLTTILVKTVGTIPAFPPPPITVLIFHGLRNQDPFIDRSHVSTLSWGGVKKAAKEEQTLLI